MNYADPRRYGRQLGGSPDCRMALPPVRPRGDATTMPLCRQSKDTSTKSHDCGCPGTKSGDVSSEDCWDCCMPGVIETKVLRRPVQCVKPQCNYCIPSIPCRDPPVSPKTSCTALCFDWSVEAPGPNDSYGLNGLNWHDWNMGGAYVEAQSMASQAAKYKKGHPGFSDNIPPPDYALPVCDRPMECYSRCPGFRRCRQDFLTDVNYFRDWRCCEAKPPAPWRPPYKQWATGRA